MVQLVQMLYTRGSADLLFLPHSRAQAEELVLRVQKVLYKETVECCSGFTQLISETEKLQLRPSGGAPQVTLHAVLVFGPMICCHFASMSGMLRKMKAFSGKNKINKSRKKGESPEQRSLSLVFLGSLLH